MAAQKMTKNQMRRAKKKEQKKAQAEVSAKPMAVEVVDEESRDGRDAEHDHAVSTPAAALSNTADDFDDDPAFSMYKELLNKFGSSHDEDEVSKEANAGNQGDVLNFDGDDAIPDEDDDEAQPKLSKKRRKQLSKLSVAELKALVRIPEVVEWQDVSSTDPRLLVQIKAQKNVVPVPSHWSLKREYLSSKRGVEKPPFRLPAFIAETGITEMRDAVLEKQAEQSLKQKQRERVQGKLGKLDIDYQKLYDAFFRFQTKPELTRFGEVYYEGKEGETDYAHFKPGELSDAVKEALGMPPGAPPPWLINQQRFGPPPSYPTLRIPGLNAPPPPGGSWGFHPGGWGKPPVDEFNRPLYGGDVFGLTTQQGAAQGQLMALPPTNAGEPVDRTLWGELQAQADGSEEEAEDSDDDYGEDDGDENDVPRGLETPGGFDIPAGYASTVNADHPGHGVETSIAGEMDLRKERRGYDTEESSAPRSAYTVLPERQVRAEGFFGSDRLYDISSAQHQQGLTVLGSEDDTRKRKKPGDVDVALDPDSLQNHDGISKDDLRRQYEQSKKDDSAFAKWNYDEDLSEMIAQESRESRKRQRTDQEKAEKRREGRYKF